MALCASLLFVTCKCAGSGVEYMTESMLDLCCKSRIETGKNRCYAWLVIA
uniref:Uncharacterized protein n=1 Tax=Arundo donax TaxID=35708 RepID=A0A0A9DGX7_ARUDO